MKHKTMIALTSVIFSMLFTPLHVFAEETTEPSETTTEPVRQIEWYQVEDGTMFRAGGFNKLDNIVCESREDTKAMEQELLGSGYVLVNTENSPLSEADRALIEQNVSQIPYGQYMTEDHELYWEMCAVYIYRPIYNDMMEQLQENGKIEPLTKCELTGSTVIANYVEWYNKERVGTIVDEFNDNIPSWCDSGFLEIESPIDCSIIFEHMSEHTLYQIYVRANEPLLIRMKTGNYVIRSINTEAIDFYETTLVYENHVVVRDYHTETEPYLLSIEQTVEKYDIQPIDISDKPDYSWEHRAEWKPIEDIPEESVVVEDDDSEPSSKSMSSKTIWCIVFISIGVIATIILVVAYKVYKKKYSQF